MTCGLNIGVEVKGGLDLDIKYSMVIVWFRIEVSYYNYYFVNKLGM